MEPSSSKPQFPETASSEEASAPPSPEASNPPENPDSGAKQPVSKRKKGLWFLSIPIALIIAICILAAILTAPLSVEIGSEIALPRLHSLQWLCSIHTDISAIDTGKLGENSLDIRLFGLISLPGKIAVVDTTPPELQLHPLRVMRGIKLSPEDFVESVNDAATVTLSFASAVSANVDGTVTIIAEDEAGNRTSAEAAFIVDDALSGAVFELGIDKKTLEASLQKLHNFKNLRLEGVDLTKCGSYPLRGEYDGKLCLFTLEIRDTTAPTAAVHSHDLLLGQTLAMEDFVTDIFDMSEVTAGFITAPDFSKPGKQKLEILLTDASGNTFTCNPELYIHNVQSKLVLEVGTPTSEYLASVNAMLNTETALPRLADNFQTDHLSIGSYETMLIGEFSTIPLEILIVDTEAPQIEVCDVTVYTGDVPDASSFVYYCDDKSAVTYSFAQAPDVSTVSNQMVTIIAKDAAGNETRASAVLHVEVNRVPPVIHGVRNLIAYEGESVSYRQGVYAIDDRDGEVSVKIDASKVKTSKAGVYNVTYTASDSDGNVSTVTAKVTINAINSNAVYPLADQILAKITAPYMSDRQKAYAIYDWCTENLKYSTSTSHLMGSFAKAAYSGFRLKYGNCYTYYAVASVLLTRAGISNIEIQRNDPDNPHYWNLVNIGGNWYHFDTCPQPSPHKMTVCLVTDSALRTFTKAGYYSFDASKYPATP